MQVRCVLGHCKLYESGLPQAGAIGRKWYLEKESESCGRKKSRPFTQTMSRTGCSLLSGSFQRWLVTVGSSRRSSLGHLLSLQLLRERCFGRGTASGWAGRGRGRKEFCRERVTLSLEILAKSPHV